MKTVIKSTLGCMMGAITEDEISSGAEILFALISGDSKVVDVVYTREYPDKTKIINSNFTLWVV